MAQKLSLSQIISKTEFKSFRLLQNKQHSHNVHLLSFDFPYSRCQFPVASSVVFRTIIDGSSATHSYTPCNSNSKENKLDFLVKKYPKGRVSNHVCALQENGRIEIKGPFEKIKYPFEPVIKSVGMIAGGTGVAPMLQIIYKMIETGDSTNVRLIFANKSAGDIILKEEIDGLAKTHRNLGVHYVVKEASDNFEGSVGHITKETLEEHLIQHCPVESFCKILVCGPPSFMEAISGRKGPMKSQGKVSGILRELGYCESQVYKF